MLVIFHVDKSFLSSFNYYIKCTVCTKTYMLYLWFELILSFQKRNVSMMLQRNTSVQHNRYWTSYIHSTIIPHCHAQVTSTLGTLPTCKNRRRNNGLNLFWSLFTLNQCNLLVILQNTLEKLPYSFFLPSCLDQ